MRGKFGLAVLAVGLVSCSGDVYVDPHTGELAGDGDLGDDFPFESEDGVGSLGQGVGSKEIVRNYRLPYKPGEAYRIVQYPHGYRDQIWNAIDIGLPRGTDVMAMREGTISAIVDYNDDYAPGTICNQSSCNGKTNFLIIQHSDGNESSYLHLAKGSVTALGLKVNDKVCRGQLVARIGHNGYSYGPHVHVSVQKGGSTGDRNQAWYGMFGKATKHIYFDEANADVKQYATYTSQNSVSCSDPNPPPPPEKPCYSGTLGRNIASGDCVQVNYSACGLSRCGWYACKDGAWACGAEATCTGAKNPHASCAPAGCYSQTLGRKVAHGECVQMSYASCGGTCRWASCNNGAWACTTALEACSLQNANPSCGAAP